MALNSAVPLFFDRFYTENQRTELAALKGLLREKKITYRKMAEITGVATRSFSNKINGYGSFDAVELDKIAEHLKIDVSKVEKYFFP